MSLNVIEPNKVIQDAVYIGDYKFSCGNNVPIYHVGSVYSLTQIIGYVKYINSSYGNVFYRGQCKLYDSIEPSIYHDITSDKARQRRNALLNEIISRAMNDKGFANFLKLDGSTISRIKIESVFQHYGIPTHYIDVVDNHWTALWFGGNRYISYLKDSFCKYEKRTINMIDVLQKRTELSQNDYADFLASIRDDMYQYLLMITVSKEETPFGNGINEGTDTISVDLRNALPSTFLRPHAQHGWTVKKKTSDNIHDLDMASNVVAILRIRVDDASKWIGTGELLSQESLFPNPHYDQGYNVLLKHTEFFEGTGWNIPVYV